MDQRGSRKSERAREDQRGLGDSSKICWDVKKDIEGYRSARNI